MLHCRYCFYHRVSAFTPFPAWLRYLTCPVHSDWFRLETKDDSLQPTVDMLLNLSIFMWIGAIAPWPQFLNHDTISFYRLLALGILILLFRRIPIILAMHKFVPQIDDIRQAVFMGFFGPIGVSAVFYLYVSLEFLKNGILVGGEIREDAKELADTMYIVVWFLIVCSVVRFPSEPPFQDPCSLYRSLSTVYPFPWVN